jgi:hypothetical protein
VVRQGAELLRSQRDLRRQHPWLCGVEVGRRICRHGLVDPAHAVDGDFLDEQVIDLQDLLGLGHGVLVTNVKLRSA